MSKPLKRISVDHGAKVDADGVIHWSSGSTFTPVVVDGRTLGFKGVDREGKPVPAYTGKLYGSEICIIVEIEIGEDYVRIHILVWDCDALLPP